MKLRTWSLATALALTALVVPAQSASAHAAAAPSCPDGSVCFWSGEGFGGDYWEWTARSGYRDMPPGLHDNVGSFVASTRACFVNWSPTEKRDVFNGDWRSQYRGDFGGRIDGVGAGAC
ncbi:peptidase inhibitor family I36 protein [Streptomyces sp. Ag109_O5-10]|uniref:peptidase inhibitor family I36 protein n=1 Tax=Streptomyces sp. Ag109_O5-10 TaxID=1855349 RepID=UPI0008964FDC|nr:peptidase inhibitor family I36 protein [Streptomyces sp. Ag109_O5-10]SEF04595.1 Peptidase inhibitor family I36 [Streptomyces sp. Ag109_O5-10]